MKDDRRVDVSNKQVISTVVRDNILGILVLLVTIVAGWTTFANALDTLGKENITQNQRMTRIESTQEEIRNDVIETNLNVRGIVTKQEVIEERMNDVLEILRENRRHLHNNEMLQ